jgi:DNA-directed RNA polymerase sigma subunit (sigma70/sigma32)
MSLADVATVFNLTRERIRQIEEVAIEKLKLKLEEEEIEEILDDAFTARGD